MVLTRNADHRAELRQRLGGSGPHRAVTVIMAVAALALLASVVFVSARSLGIVGGHQTHQAVRSPSTPPDEGGLADVHHGYRLELLGAPPVRGAAVPVAFRILDPSGRPQTDYDVGHTKPLHMYVLRDDMSKYQHLHPELSGDTWRATISVPDGGQYRIYTEFLPRGWPDPTHPVVLGSPFTVPGDTAFVPLPPPAPSVTVDGFTVSRPEGAADVPVQQLTELKFRITDAAGHPVDRLDAYLGAYAHMSAYHSLTMGLLHQHPRGTFIDSVKGGPELTVAAQFANRGEHRLFLEFSVDGQVHRAEFTVFVT
jgi:hypothetical protein